MIGLGLISVIFWLAQWIYMHQYILRRKLTFSDMLRVDFVYLSVIIFVTLVAVGYLI